MQKIEDEKDREILTHDIFFLFINPQTKELINEAAKLYPIPLYKRVNSWPQFLVGDFVKILQRFPNAQVCAHHLVNQPQAEWISERWARRFYEKNPNVPFAVCTMKQKTVINTFGHSWLAKKQKEDIKIINSQNHQQEHALQKAASAKALTSTTKLKI